MDNHVGDDGWRGFLSMHVIWLYGFLWFGGGCCVLGALAELSYRDTDWALFRTLGLCGLVMLGLGYLWYRIKDPMD